MKACSVKACSVEACDVVACGAKTCRVLRVEWAKRKAGGESCQGLVLSWQYRHVVWLGSWVGGW